MTVHDASCLRRKIKFVAQTHADILAARAVLQVEVWQKYANESALARYFLPSEYECSGILH